jgi:hypothetical protein
VAGRDMSVFKMLGVPICMAFSLLSAVVTRFKERSYGSHCLNNKSADGASFLANLEAMGTVREKQEFSS